MIELAKYRLEKAKKNLKASEDNLKQNHYGFSINRSYYVMFTSARALLALKEKDSSKHSGIISLFNQYIIKSGLFPKKYSKYLQYAKRLREDADYGDFIEFNKEETQLQFDHATEFVEEAERTMAKMLEEKENRD